MNRLPTTLPAIAALLALAVGGAQAASFVTEATSVVDQVIDQGQAANSEIDAFYQDFSQTAARMVDLEARVERWKSEGYLCEQYIDCVEKYDLIYAYYGQSMAEIQQAFQRHQDGILAALSRFNRIVYQGKDQLSDLRSDELAALPVVIERLRNAHEELRSRDADLQQECPERTTAQCKRKWRALQRDLNRTTRELQRIAYTRKLATLRESIITRLDGVLERYSDVEEEAVGTLAQYAFIFERYGELSGSDGIGKLLTAATDLGKLDGKLRQLQDFGKGLEIHVLDMGSLINERLDQVAGGDITVQSRRGALFESGDLLEGNDRLLRDLEQEIGLAGTTSG